MDDVARLHRRVERERAARQEAERIAEETIRILYDRQREIQLVRAAAVAANEAHSVADAMQAALDLVCAHSGWPLGHVLFVDEQRRLVSSSIWHDRDNEHGQSFAWLRHRREEARFEPGVGLPGEVLVTAAAIWIDDVSSDPESPRARGAVEIGVRAAFAVPVLVGAEVEAVLEFFHVQPVPLDANLLELVGQVGTLLGRVIERERSGTALRDTNLRLEETLRELRVAQQQMVQQERLRALGQMASGIAHDFNNALMPMVGYAQLLLDSPAVAGNAQARRWLQTILTAATDAAMAVARLREFYRQRRANETELPINLNDIAREVVELTYPSWSTQALVRGVKIIVETDLPDVPRIMGVVSELRQAVANLVLNAIDAMPRGGAILLRSKVVGGEVTLDVQDTGHGMTPEVRARCLDPFFTTKGKRGSGMGLGIVYGVVQRHHGRLDIDSSVGRGTTITLGFPIAAVSAALEPPSRPQAVSGLRVLVVEDDATARELLQDLLVADGHAVVTSPNGFDALTQLQEDGFDVVLTDRAMPTMTGDELAVLIKRSPNPVPVVMITGLGLAMADAGERPLGVDVVLAKPVTRDALREVLSRVRQRQPGPAPGRRREDRSDLTS